MKDLVKKPFVFIGFAIELYVEKFKEKNVTDLRLGALCEQTNGSVRRRSDLRGTIGVRRSVFD